MQSKLQTLADTAETKKENNMEYKDFEEKRWEGWDTPTSYESDRQLALSQAFPALMRKVYIWMTMALAITAITAYGVASSPVLLSAIYSSKFTFFGLIIAELALVFYVSARINRLSLTTATLLFILYSVINGATLASIFAFYSMSVIGQTFLVTAGTFGVMAVYGYFTKKDLTSWGRLLLMALIGLIIAGIANMFFRSTISWSAASACLSSSASRLTTRRRSSRCCSCRKTWAKRPRRWH